MLSCKGCIGLLLATDQHGVGWAGSQGVSSNSQVFLHSLMSKHENTFEEFSFSFRNSLYLLGGGGGLCLSGRSNTCVDPVQEYVFIQWVKHYYVWLYFTEKLNFTIMLVS